MQGDISLTTVLLKHDDFDTVTAYVDAIIEKQKKRNNYDYMINEQIEIDKLVYKMYNLDEVDIQEVENWYFRRYPKLARVIEKKLMFKEEDN